MQVELLGLLLLQPDREWTLSELARVLGATQSSVHRELTRAVDAGIVSRRSSQRPHAFRAASDSPTYEALREILDRTVGVPKRLREALGPFPGVRAAAIHGSWSRGAPGPTSDIDLIVVADDDRRRVHRAIRGVGRQIGREIDASIVTPDGFRDLLRGENPFLQTILRGPRIDVVGQLNDLV